MAAISTSTFSPPSLLSAAPACLRFSSSFRWGLLSLLLFWGFYFPLGAPRNLQGHEHSHEAGWAGFGGLFRRRCTPHRPSRALSHLPGKKQNKKRWGTMQPAWGLCTHKSSASTTSCESHLWGLGAGGEKGPCTHDTAAEVFGHSMVFLSPWCRL